MCSSESPFFWWELCGVCPSPMSGRLSLFPNWTSEIIKCNKQALACLQGWTTQLSLCHISTTTLPWVGEEILLQFAHNIIHIRNKDMCWTNHWSLLFSTSGSFPNRNLSKPAWRYQGLNWGPFAGKAEFFPWTTTPYCQWTTYFSILIWNLCSNRSMEGLGLNS